MPDFASPAALYLLVVAGLAGLAAVVVARSRSRRRLSLLVGLGVGIVAGNTVAGAVWPEAFERLVLGGHAERIALEQRQAEVETAIAGLEATGVSPIAIDEFRVDAAASMAEREEQRVLAIAAHREAAALLLWAGAGLLLGWLMPMPWPSVIARGEQAGAPSSSTTRSSGQAVDSGPAAAAAAAGADLEVRASLGPSRFHITHETFFIALWLTLFAGGLTAIAFHFLADVPVPTALAIGLAFAGVGASLDPVGRMGEFSRAGIPLVIAVEATVPIQGRRPKSAAEARGGDDADETPADRDDDDNEADAEVDTPRRGLPAAPTAFVRSSAPGGGPPSVGLVAWCVAVVASLGLAWWPQGPVMATPSGTAPAAMSPVPAPTTGSGVAPAASPAAATSPAPSVDLDATALLPVRSEHDRIWLLAVLPIALGVGIAMRRLMLRTIGARLSRLTQRAVQSVRNHRPTGSADHPDEEPRSPSAAEARAARSLDLPRGADAIAVEGSADTLRRGNWLLDVALGLAAALTAAALIYVDVGSQLTIALAVVAVLIGADARWLGGASGWALAGASSRARWHFATPLADAAGMQVALAVILFVTGWITSGLLAAAVLAAITIDLTMGIRYRLITLLPSRPKRT